MLGYSSCWFPDLFLALGLVLYPGILSVLESDDVEMFAKLFEEFHS